MLLEGAGLANVLAADDPKVFTDPQSLSFEKIDVSTGAQRAVDAADGFRRGRRRRERGRCRSRRRRRRRASTIDVPGSVALAPGGDAAIPVVVRAAASAGDGLRTTASSCSPATASQRRVPYAFLVERPGAAQRARRCR